MKKEPVYQPRGTRDGTAGLKGKTVWVVISPAYVHAYTNRTKAKYHQKHAAFPEETTLCECRIQ